MTSSLLPARNADLTRTKCAERLVYKSPIAILSCSGFLVKVDCSYEARSCAVLMILKEERWACLHKNFAWLRVSSWLYNCYLLCSNCFFICTLQNVTWKMSDFMKCEKWCWVPWVSSLWASLVIFKLFFLRTLQRSLHTHPSTGAALFWNCYERKLLFEHWYLFFSHNCFFLKEDHVEA